MEVKPGYQQTEVGVIPEDWQAKPLRDGINLLSGHHVLAQHCNTEGRGKPYITGPADFPNGVIRNTKFTEKPSTVCRQGDILVTVKGSGAGTIVFADAEYCISRQLMAIRVSDWDTGYVYESLRRDASLFGAAATGLIPGLSRGDILDKKLAKPPLPEQRAIAEVLSDVDGLLGGVDRLIAKKRDLKQAAMQQLLTGQTRLPDFHGEWEVKTLHEVCQKIQDGTHFSPKLGGNDYLYVTSKNIRFGMLDMSTAERISAAEHFKIYARCDVKKGDLLLTKDGANTGNAALNPMDEPFSLLSSVAMLRFDCRYHSAAYFMYQILSDFGQMQIKDAMSGNAITRLTLQKIRALRFSAASLPEQTAIATVLSEMDGELAVLEQRREKTRALKQAMMQELLTGRTRLV